jgi:hypothetical protein
MDYYQPVVVLALPHRLVAYLDLLKKDYLLGEQ